MRVLKILLVIAFAFFTANSFAQLENEDLVNDILLPIIQSQMNYYLVNIEKASVMKKTDGSYSVEVQLSPKATDRLVNITQISPNQPFNLTLDKSVISIDLVQNTSGRQFQITGLKKEEMEKFFKLLKTAKEKSLL